MCMFNKAYVAQKEYMYRSQSKDKSKKQQCEITEQQRKMPTFRATTRQKLGKQSEICELFLTSIHPLMKENKTGNTPMQGSRMEC